MAATSKKENHKHDLLSLFKEFIETDNAERLMAYLISNSNLPGRRANLKLATAFAAVVENYAVTEPEKVWGLCLETTEITADEAPVNDPKSFIPFCDAMGIGAIGSVTPELFAQVWAILKTLAHDSRWRMRN